MAAASHVIDNAGTVVDGGEPSEGRAGGGPNAGRGHGNGNQVVRPLTGASMPKNAVGKRKVNKLRTALWLRTNEVVFSRLFRF